MIGVIDGLFCWFPPSSFCYIIPHISLVHPYSLMLRSPQFIPHTPNLSLRPTCLMLDHISLHIGSLGPSVHTHCHQTTSRWYPQPWLRLWFPFCCWCLGTLSHFVIDLPAIHMHHWAKSHGRYLKCNSW